MGFKWDSRELSRGVRELSPRVDAYIGAVVEFQATRGMAYMRAQARWTDRTGNARAGLFTIVRHFPMVRHEAVFSHTMSYGFWLEVANDERYAIVMQSVRIAGRDIMAQLRGGLGDIR